MSFDTPKYQHKMHFAGGGTFHIVAFLVFWMLLT